MQDEKIEEIIANALSGCEEGSLAFHRLRGCHRDRLLSRAHAAISAVREAGYDLAPRPRRLDESPSRLPG